MVFSVIYHLELRNILLLSSNVYIEHKKLPKCKISRDQNEGGATSSCIKYKSLLYQWWDLFQC